MKIEETEILSTIAKFYPIGLQGYGATEYPGYQKWTQIIGQKIDDLAEHGKDPCQPLVVELETIFPFQALHNYSFYQLPSYTVLGEISSFEDNSVKRETTFCLDISLLGNYYSYFIEDKITYKDKGEHSLLANLPPSIILSCRAVDNNSLATFLSNVEPVVQKYFVDWQPIHHVTLFSMVMQAVPYHDLSLTGMCTAYDLLLSNRYASGPFLHLNA